MLTEADLNPCSHCGCDPVHVWVDELCEGVWVVKCDVCLSRGPECIDKELAIGRWNERGGDTKWIAVKDGFPQKDTHVLVLGKHGYDIASFSCGFWWSASQGAVFRYAITHWMPLPDRPEGGQP